jgi:hypothetical protein
MNHQIRFARSEVWLSAHPHVFQRTCPRPGHRFDSAFLLPIFSVKYLTKFRRFLSRFQVDPKFSRFTPIQRPNLPSKYVVAGQACPLQRRPGSPLPSNPARSGAPRPFPVRSGISAHRGRSSRRDPLSSPRSVFNPHPRSPPRVSILTAISPRFSILTRDLRLGFQSSPAISPVFDGQSRSAANSKSFSA